MIKVIDEEDISPGKGNSMEVVTGIRADLQ